MIINILRIHYELQRLDCYIGSGGLECYPGFEGYIDLRGCYTDLRAPHCYTDIEETYYYQILDYFLLIVDQYPADIGQPVISFMPVFFIFIASF